MSGLGGRTKKVTTYGKKKTQIISIHTDISNPVLPSSPLPTTTVKTKRPVLQSKLSNDITNIPIPTTPIPKSKLGLKDKTKGKLVEQEEGKGVIVATPQSSPELIFKARKVNRPGRKVIPKSPISSSSPSPIKRKPSKVPEVVIPIRSSTTRKVKPLGELTKKFQEITIEDTPPATVKAKEVDLRVSDEEALQDLLSTCSSTFIQPFSEFLKGDQLPKYGSIRKVGEASYSEVFGLTSQTIPSTEAEEGDEEVQFVLKVIPLLQSTDIGKAMNKPMPDCSKMEDVEREIEVTKRMSQTPGGGFVEYIGSYVVEGEYPEGLLEEWDEFKATEGSASVRPSALPPTQKYCLLLLSHAGKDLEMFKFHQTQGWHLAASVFWQLVSSLARAEKWTEFEHRDLHEGQILIHPYVPSTIQASSSRPKIQPEEKDENEENYLNPSICGLKATIIDFGLSRLTLPSPSPDQEKEKSRCIWTELPEEVYEGKGSQWDLYRSMRSKIEEHENGKGWEEFNPITNVMWLHYILRYITPKLRIPKAPNRRSSKSTSIYLREEKAYNLLNQVEKVLGWSIDYENTSKRRGLRGDVECQLDKKLGSAQDVLGWGRDKGWVRELD